MTYRRWLEAKELTISVTYHNFRFSVCKLIEPKSGLQFYEVQMYGGNLPYDQNHFLPNLFTSQITAIQEAMAWVCDCESYGNATELHTENIEEHNVSYL